MLKSKYYGYSIMNRNTVDEKECFLSVIIPVYNAEKYLRRCLESFKISHNLMIQIILINDGSNDGSKEICERFKNRYPDQVICIHKKNAGVSAARNDGLKMAKGKYVVFIDADDYVSDNYVDEIYRMTLENADMYLYGYRKVDFTGTVLESHEPKKEIIDISQNCPDNIFNKLENQAWNKIFLNGIIQENNITFDTSMRWSEDLDFWCKYCVYAKKIYCVNTILYNYLINDKGAVASIEPVGLVHQQKAFQHQLGLLVEKKAQQDAFRMVTQLHIELLVTSIQACLSRGYSLVEIKKVLRKMELRVGLKSEPFKLSARIKKRILCNNHLNILRMYFTFRDFMKGNLRNERVEKW